MAKLMEVESHCRESDVRKIFRNSLPDNAWNSEGWRPVKRGAYLLQHGNRVLIAMTCLSFSFWEIYSKFSPAELL